MNGYTSYMGTSWNNPDPTGYLDFNKRFQQSYNTQPNQNYFTTETPNWVKPQVGLSSTGMNQNPSGLLGTMQGYVNKANQFGDMFGGWSNLYDVGMSGIKALGAFKQMGLAKNALNMQKDAFNWQKAMGEKNLGNQIKSYNNLLKDQMQFRAQMETGNKNAYDNEYEKKKL